MMRFHITRAAPTALSENSTICPGLQGLIGGSCKSAGAYIHELAQDLERLGAAKRTSTAFGRLTDSALSCTAMFIATRACSDSYIFSLRLRPARNAEALGSLADGLRSRRELPRSSCAPWIPGFQSLRPKRQNRLRTHPNLERRERRPQAKSCRDFRPGSSLLPGSRHSAVRGCSPAQPRRVDSAESPISSSGKCSARKWRASGSISACRARNGGTCSVNWLSR